MSNPRTFWTAADDALLLANADLGPWDRAALFPHRTKHAVNARLGHLKDAANRTVKEPQPPAVRYLAPDYDRMSITARHFGDPLPNRSALSQRQQGGQQHG